MRAYFHPDELLHHPQSYFSRGKMRKPQEIPERVQGILRGLDQLGLDVERPQDGGLAALGAVHSAPYLQFLAHAHAEWQKIPADWGDEVVSNIFVREPNALRGILAQAAAYLADGSCPIGQHTWQSAYWSAQCAIAATQHVLGGAHHGYALCRPPGHHARAAAAGGFCYLNNAAIAAELLRSKYARVAILDADMHHGQGTQEIFYERSDVFYVSIHADPTNYYPVVAGFSDEVGAGAGLGFNLNLPMPHGASETRFFAQLTQALRAIEAFAPEALVFSLGFDIFQDDPQSQVAFTSAGFALLGHRVASLGLPTVYVQEGGYHVESLTQNTTQFFSGVLRHFGA